MTAAAVLLLTDSGAVTTRPCLLYSVVLTASGAAQISVKDGGTSGTEIVGLRLGGAGSVVFAPCVAVAIGTSLWVTVDAGTVEVAVVHG